MITHSLKIPTVCSFDCLPSRKHQDDAGADLRYDGQLPLFIGPGERRNLPTGVSVEIPAGYAGLVCPRSGLAVKHGITVLNSPGIIDAGYRGQIRVPLINLGDIEIRINPGDRVAQLLIVAVAKADFYEADTLGESDRGANGFGSTGAA